MFNEANLKATGKLRVELYDEFGNLKEERNVTNVVTATGLNYIVSRMKDATATAMSHMAVGSDNTAAASGDTALGSELGRVSLTSTTTGTANIQYVADFGAGTGTGAITEAGILNGSTGGTLLCRTVFSTVNKAAADTLKITWTVTVADS